MQIYSLFYTQWNKVYIELKRSKIKETASYIQEARKKVTLSTVYSFIVHVLEGTFSNDAFLNLHRCFGVSSAG